MSIYIAADVYRMLNPTDLLATLVHVTWSDLPAGGLGVLKLRMCITKEEWTLSYDLLLTLLTSITQASGSGGRQYFGKGHRCSPYLL